MSTTPIIERLAHGFYGKLLVGPVRILAHDCVSDAAMHEAHRRVIVLLGGCPAIRANLTAAGAELHVIGCDQAVTDLPMYRHMAGVPFEGELTMDERGRGYGGLHACCAEEALLGLPTARHSDHRDVVSHEIAHTVLSFGLDPVLRNRWTERWKQARPLWRSAYAASNAHEFFAELTMWYVGSRGEYADLPHPRPGRAWLATHDPESEALMHAIYGGQLPPMAIRWDELTASDATRSLEGQVPTDLVVHNHTTEEVTLFWLDYQGKERAFGSIPAGGLRSQSTYASHPWLLSAGERRWGPFVPGSSPGRVTLR